MKNRKPNTLANPTRRTFWNKFSALYGLVLTPNFIKYQTLLSPFAMKPSQSPDPSSPKSIIGQYGPQLWKLNHHDAGEYSFRNDRWKDIKSWKTQILPRIEEFIASPQIDFSPNPKLIHQYKYDGLEIEELSWDLPYGRPAKALFLKPIGAKGPLPAILGLHDHGGNKYFGRRKITKTGDNHPLMDYHQDHYYSGKAWANEIAKKGYAVLVHDTFTFGTRRVQYDDISDIPWGECNTDGLTDSNPENSENIEKYNTWAGNHEHIMAKSLFSGGYTWPGIFLYEDQLALDILSAREDVDSDKIGCAGLSGGGLRTVYLGGLDSRIKCAVCVGFMSTWKDFMLNKSYTHTWMTYTPVLPKYMNFPEILGMRVPLPTMVLNNSEDSLYTVPEMKKAVEILKGVYSKAGSSDTFSAKMYSGPHKFDAEMQEDAFAWMDKWLKG